MVVLLVVVENPNDLDRHENYFPRRHHHPHGAADDGGGGLDAAD